MGRGLYALATGMVSSMQELDVTANALANANTTGYKNDALAFDNAYNNALNARGGCGHSIGTLGVGAVLKDQFVVFKAGSVQETGNSLDVAILSDRGLFAVQTPAGVRYTRSGAFRLDQQGKLTTQTGQPILNNQQQPITIPAGSKVEINSKGAININGNPATQLGVFDGTPKKLEGNLYQLTNPKPFANAELKQGAIELSTVNPIDQSLSMIKVHRNMEIAQKAAKQHDEMMKNLIQTLQKGSS